MLYKILCIQTSSHNVQENSMDEAIEEAKRMCPFYPDKIMIECIEEEEDEEEE